MKKAWNNKRILHKKGFSLVEALVAITVLLIAIVGPMAIATQGLQASFFSREQTTAVYLAQEAVESIEKLRDDSALAAFYGPSGPWDWYDSGLVDSCKDGSGCDYDVVEDDYHSCLPIEDCNLLEDNNISAGASIGHYYQYSEGDSSLFTRVIKLSDVGGREVLVTVEVTWRANLFGRTASTTLQTRIFNQYDSY